MFVEKLNKKPSGVYIIEEEKTIAEGKWEGFLDHDNVNYQSISIYTGSKYTGEKVENFFISTPSETPWKTYLKIFSNSEKVYITYETTGDQVEAEDINELQEAITDTSNNLNDYKDSNNREIKQLKNRATTLENNKAEKTYVDTELNKKANKDNVFTKEEVLQKIQEIIGAAPEALDTLEKLATALDNDPNFATNIINLLSTKVDKEQGKGLSTEDYTTEEKQKLSGIETGANKYIHPATHSADIIVQNANKRFVSDTEKADWNGKETVEGSQAKADNTLKSAKEYIDTHDSNTIKHITSEERTNWNDSNNKRHIHENKSILDKITQTLIDSWNNAVEHTTDTVKHITSTERNKWNTVSNKADKIYVDETFATKEELSGAGNGDMLKSIYDRNNNGKVDVAEVANSVPWNGITGKPSTFTPAIHEHNIQDLRYRTIDFYVDGDANTYYPVVISNISSLDDGQPSQKTLEIVRGYSWDAPDVWNTATHRGGLQVYLNTYALGWGGMNYFMDITMGQTYSKMVADIIIPLPDTNNILIWLRGGYAKYRLIAYDRNIEITPYIGDFINKPGTQYEQVYSPRTDRETPFDFIGLKKFNSIPEHFIGGGYRNIKAGNRLVTIKDIPTKLSQLSNDKGYLSKGVTWNDLKGV